MKSILDKSFVYRNAANTNVRLTIQRERRRLAETEAAKKAEAETAELEVRAKVCARRIK